MTVQTTVTFEDKPVEAIRASLRAMGIAIDLLHDSRHRERGETLRDERPQRAGEHRESADAHRPARLGDSMPTLTWERQVLAHIWETPSQVVSRQEYEETGFSTDTLTELTRRGYIQRNRHDIRLSTTGRDIVQPRARRARQPTASHHHSRS